MKKVLGRIVLQGSNLGIPHVLVTAYDADSHTEAGTAGGSPPHEHGPPHEDGQARWIRLGSVITDSREHFALDCEYERENGARSKRHDLGLIVTTAQESCIPGEEQPTRIATCYRRDATPVVSFRIALDEARLAAAGVLIPRDPSDVEHLIEQRRVAAERQARLDAESRRLFAEKLEARRHFERLAAPKFEQFLHALSTVPPEQRNVPMAPYVPPGASVLSANRAIIQAGITGRINKSSRTGIATLSDEVADRFRDADGNFLTEIAADLIEQHLGSKTLLSAGSLLRQTPLSMICRQQPVDPCVEILEGKEPQEPEEEEPPELEPPPEPGPPDIPLLIGTLVEHLPPPESASVFKVHSRAGLEEVQQRVDGFSLHSGPADAPALHDFHHLQIAFEDVWQELFDDNVVQTGKELYTDLVELGVDPNEYLMDPFKKQLAMQAAKSMFPPKKTAQELTATASEPPTLVIREFDITPRQWAVLQGFHKPELEVLAEKIQIVRQDKSTALATLEDVAHTLTAEQYRAIKDTVRIKDDELIRENRQMGDSMIRYADHKLEAPEKFDQFHPSLEALAKAMKEPYRFSIYARIDLSAA